MNSLNIELLSYLHADTININTPVNADILSLLCAREHILINSLINLNLLSLKATNSQTINSLVDVDAFVFSSFTLPYLHKGWLWDPEKDFLEQSSMKWARSSLAPTVVDLCLFGLRQIPGAGQYVRWLEVPVKLFDIASKVYKLYNDGEDLYQELHEGWYKRPSYMLSLLGPCLSLANQAVNIGRGVTGLVQGNIAIPDWKQALISGSLGLIGGSHNVNSIFHANYMNVSIVPHSTTNAVFCYDNGYSLGLSKSMNCISGTTKSNDFTVTSNYLALGDFLMSGEKRTLTGASAKTVIGQLSLADLHLSGFNNVLISGEGIVDIGDNVKVSGNTLTIGGQNYTAQEIENIVTQKEGTVYENFDISDETCVKTAGNVFFDRSFTSAPKSFSVISDQLRVGEDVVIKALQSVSLSGLKSLIMLAGSEIEVGEGCIYLFSENDILFGRKAVHTTKKYSKKGSEYVIVAHWKTVKLSGGQGAWYVYCDPETGKYSWRRAAVFICAGGKILGEGTKIFGSGDVICYGKEEIDLLDDQQQVLTKYSKKQKKYTTARDTAEVKSESGKVRLISANGGLTSNGLQVEQGDGLDIIFKNDINLGAVIGEDTSEKKKYFGLQKKRKRKETALTASVSGDSDAPVRIWSMEGNIFAPGLKYENISASPEDAANSNRTIHFHRGAGKDLYLTNPTLRTTKTKKGLSCNINISWKGMKAEASLGYVSSSEQSLRALENGLLVDHILFTSSGPDNKGNVFIENGYYLVGYTGVMQADNVYQSGINSQLKKTLFYIGITGKASKSEASTALTAKGEYNESNTWSLSEVHIGQLYVDVENWNIKCGELVVGNIIGRIGNILIVSPQDEFFSVDGELEVGFDFLSNVAYATGGLEVSKGAKRNAISRIKAEDASTLKVDKVTAESAEVELKNAEVSSYVYKEGPEDYDLGFGLNASTNDFLSKDWSGNAGLSVSHNGKTAGVSTDLSRKNMDFGVNANWNGIGINTAASWSKDRQNFNVGGSCKDYSASGIFSITAGQSVKSKSLDFKAKYKNLGASGKRNTSKSKKGDAFQKTELGANYGDTNVSVSFGKKQAEDTQSKNISVTANHNDVEVSGSSNAKETLNGDSSIITTFDARYGETTFSAKSSIEDKDSKKIDVIVQHEDKVISLARSLDEGVSTIEAGVSSGDKKLYMECVRGINSSSITFDSSYGGANVALTRGKSQTADNKSKSIGVIASHENLGVSYGSNTKETLNGDSSIITTFDANYDDACVALTYEKEKDLSTGTQSSICNIDAALNELEASVEFNTIQSEEGKSKECIFDSNYKRVSVDGKYIKEKDVKEFSSSVLVNGAGVHLTLDSNPFVSIKNKKKSLVTYNSGKIEFPILKKNHG